MKSLNMINNKISKEFFENLKSKYILQKIFGNLLKKKLLDIIKYNKNIQKGINININDYKNFSEKYSSIEIEIIPAVNKYGDFININKEDEIFFSYIF